jgi:hypothetical protein
VIPDPWIVTLLYFVGYALAGAALGVFTGMLAALVLKLRISGITKDCLFGSFGFLLGLVAVAFTPWPENTISYHTDGGTLVSSTMNRYQHPVRVGIVVAIILPLLRTAYRFKRESSVKPTA